MYTVVSFHFILIIIENIYRYLIHTFIVKLFTVSINTDINVLYCITVQVFFNQKLILDTRIKFSRFEII